MQDEASSVVWGMPGQVTAAGLADATFSLDAMASQLIQRSMVGRFMRGTFASPAESSVPSRPLESQREH